MDSGNGQERWPENPGELAYQLDLVLELFNRIQNGERTDLLEALLDTVDWGRLFGGPAESLSPADVEELKRYYRAKFAHLDRFYLAEQLSTQLMSALMVSGDISFSDELQEFGRLNPELWNEIRTFFTRKELATSTAMLADKPAE